MLDVEVALEHALLASLYEHLGDVERVVIAEAGGEMHDLEAAMAEDFGRAPVDASTCGTLTVSALTIRTFSGSV